jgi:hypothetical protein
MTGTAPEHPLKRSTHKLKLGVFGLNVSGGCSMTERTDTLKVEWDESVKIAQLAEQAGIEAVIPVARWKGMGGKVNFNHRTLKPSPGPLV